MKTLSAAMQTHVDGDGTSLAACWQITRKDGVVHRFTDHDADITFGGERFVAVGGFSRSNVLIAAGTRVDNLDVEGLITVGDVTEEDIREGRLDQAEVRIFLVNWRDLAAGDIKIKRGFIGQVEIPEDGSYRAELRGLTQAYSRVVGDLYQASCRADLFDSDCKLVAADFTERTLVSSVNSAISFEVPEFETLLSPEPALTSGLRAGATVEPAGSLRLARGPAELGTPDRPFLLSTPADLNTTLRDNPTAWFALVNDIDMGAFGFWTPIPAFRGGLDGRGWEIQNLDVDRVSAAAGTGSAGLFDRLEQGAVVRRLGLRGGIFVKNGGLLQYAAPLAARWGTTNRANLFGRVEDCYAIGCEVILATTNSNQGGGLLGQTRDLAQVRRCFAACPIDSDDTNVGALVGNITEGAQSDNFADDDRPVGPGLGTGETTTLLTTAQAQAAASLPGLDFVNTWLRPEDQTAAAYVDTGGETLTFTDVGAGSRDTIARDAGSWITDGFEVGDRITVSGTVSSDGTYEIVGVTASTLTTIRDNLPGSESVAGSGVTVTAGKYPRLRQQQVP